MGLNAEIKIRKSNNKDFNFGLNAEKTLRRTIYFWFKQRNKPYEKIKDKKFNFGLNSEIAPYKKKK